MGTQATVHFRDKSSPEAILYCHYDGYPHGENGLASKIMSFLKEVKEQNASSFFRRPDILAARFVVWMVEQDGEILYRHNMRICLANPDGIRYWYDVVCSGGDDLPVVYAYLVRDPEDNILVWESTEPILMEPVTIGDGIL